MDAYTDAEPPRERTNFGSHPHGYRGIQRVLDAHIDSSGSVIYGS